MKKISIAIIASGLILASCNRKAGWTLSGEAPEGVETVYVQAPTYSGGWYDLDSTSVKDGKYVFNLPEANGTIYRIKLADHTVCIPADSTESLTLTAAGVRGGSFEAELFNRIDSLANDSRAVLIALDGIYSSTAAYYATRLNKDFRLLRTIANRYIEERPEDPRTSILRAELEKKMPKSSDTTTRQVIYAEEISYYDIELMDRNGQNQKLSDCVDSNSIAVLAYVDFTDSNTPSITRALGDAQASGAGIYEIGFAENQHLWANASEGLPWVSVYQSDAANRNHISQYAVSSFPTFFIFKNGEIVERVTDHTKLSETVQKLK
ncbi:MAG: hypothetical protein NC301_03970 [Bacteroides sp.]|nr:hypothetical protein [Bacteroides sp.]MCM1378654.1 hypothetical protein [Bacteroides sp.]MCM1444927.1 hypothetical protein [Prevotella sp.]